MLQAVTLLNDYVFLPRSINLGKIWSWFTVTPTAPTRPVDPEKGGEPLAWVYQSEQERHRMPVGFINPSHDGKALIFIPLAEDGAYAFQKAERLNLAPDALTVHQDKRTIHGKTYISAYTLFEEVLAAPRVPALEQDTTWAASCYFGKTELKKVLPPKSLAHNSLA
ncbi:MAG: hypothetical protein PHW63_01225 [Alphaproteobacteria bacterium]|nr:hypothetical protein [Alphaproteobacteria bacterium]